MYYSIVTFKQKSMFLSPEVVWKLLLWKGKLRISFNLSHELCKLAKLMDNSTNNENFQCLLSMYQTLGFSWWD